MSGMQPDVSVWRGVSLVERVAEGQRNEVWFGDSPYGPVAVRRSRRAADSLAWELDLLDALDADGFLVPVALRTTAGDRSHDGVVVQRWIDGRPPATDGDWTLVADELRRLHDRCRGWVQRPGCIAVPELGRDGHSVDADMSVLPDDVAADVMAVFADLRDVERSVIHGDPGAPNIRITSDGRVGLLDWDESRVDVVWHDLSELGVQVLTGEDLARAGRLSNAWEAVNAWTAEPEYARRRIARLRSA